MAIRPADRSQRRHGPCLPKSLLNVVQHPVAIFPLPMLRRVEKHRRVGSAHDRGLAGTVVKCRKFIYTRPSSNRRLLIAACTWTVLDADNSA